MFLKWALSVINAISLIIIILYTAVCAPTFSIDFYEREFEKNGTYAVVGMGKEDLLEVTAHMLRYMQGSEKDLNIETVVHGQKRLFFSEIEVSHMADVLGLFNAGKTLFYISTALFFISFIVLMLLKGSVKAIGKCYFSAPLGTITVFLVIGLLFLINFNAAFTVFHEIFFKNDLWILNPRVDLLVNIVPTQFFMDIAALCLIIFIGGLTIMSLAGLYLMKKSKKISKKASEFNRR